MSFFIPQDKDEFQLDNQVGFPSWAIYLTLIISASPLILIFLGFEFGGAPVPEEPVEGSRVWVTHALLEWSSFGVAAFAAVLAFTHYAMKRDRVSPGTVIKKKTLNKCIEAYFTPLLGP